MFTPVRLTHLDDRLEPLRREAAAEGFQFIDRLIEDWQTAGNRFDAPGECLLGVTAGDALVAVGGLNRDPYEPSAEIGRIRHVYVMRKYRRQGASSALLRALLAEADLHYTALRLRTDTPEAAAFYVRHGFVPVTSPWATHARASNGS